MRFNGWTWARLLVVVLVTGWVFGGPAYRQAFGGKTKWVPRWRMFAGVGHNVCQARFVQVHPDGTRERLDRWEVLGRDKWAKKSANFRRIEGKIEVFDTAYALCRKLGDDADVRAFAKCGSRKGWPIRVTGKKNLCDAKNRTGASRKRKKRRKLRKPGPSGAGIPPVGKPGRKP